MDLDGRCENASLAILRAFPLLDRHGRDVAVAIAKLTYQIDDAGYARLAAAPVRVRDELAQGGGVHRPSDAAVEKPGTDVGLVGTLVPPPRMSSLLSWLQVGALRKIVKVVGPRVYTKSFRGAAEPSAPGVLGPTPLRHDLVFGGRDTRPDGTIVELAENPIGRGFAVDPTAVVGTAAPQLCAPEDDAPSTSQATACFAPIAAAWEPRRSRAGTFDDKWAEERAPIAPRDAEPRAACWSGANLWSEIALAPDVPIEVGGLRPGPPWRFQLPGYAVRFAAELDGARRDLPTHLDGLLVDVDQRTVELTFRGTVRLPRPWDRLDRILAFGFGELPRAAFEDPLPLERLAGAFSPTAA